MIDLVSSNVLPLTFLLCVLLILRKTLLKQFGSQLCYQLWLLVPLYLLLYFLPNFSFNTYTLPPTVFTVILTDIPQQTNTLVKTPWITSTWLVGAFILCTYFVLTHQRFHKTINATLDPTLRSLNFQQKNVPPVYRSEHINSPMLVGLIAPKLILPFRFEIDYNAQQQKLIIAHEICHYRRGDLYWNLLASACLVLFWFHPLAWFAYSKFRQDQELSCDHNVMVDLTLEDRKQYAHALLSAVENAQSVGVLTMPFGKFGDKSTMLERIQQLQSNTKHSKLTAAGIFSLAIFLISSTTLAEPASTKASVSTKPALAKKAALPDKDELSKREEHPIDVIYPKYPIEAAKNNIEGSVTFLFDINRQGHPENITIIESVPNGVFDEQAINAFKQWRYNPPTDVKKSHTVQLDFAMGTS